MTRQQTCTHLEHAEIRTKGGSEGSEAQGFKIDEKAKYTERGENDVEIKVWGGGVNGTSDMVFEKK